jgi:hypothetical protein
MVASWTRCRLPPLAAATKNEVRKMTSSQLFRISGLALLVGAVAFIVHIVVRSVITAGPHPVTFYREGLWVPITALGVLGAALVLLGLPAIYARMAGPTGLLGLVGVVPIALAWLFLGVFLSLYGVLVAPLLADQAPSLVAASAPLPLVALGALGSRLWSEYAPAKHAEPRVQPSPG